MTTPEHELSDTSRTRAAFLRAVAGARLPIRAAELVVDGLDRRLLQKRLERLRRNAGGSQVDDEELREFARQELARSEPESRGLEVLETLAHPRARGFAREAGLQAAVLGDWVELNHSPGDRGWSRDEIDVTLLARGTIFARGRAQSWRSEKRRYLVEQWAIAREDPVVRRQLTGNRLKVDLQGFKAMGTEDAPSCAIEIAPVDWQTSLALNARLDEPSPEGTIRERWGQPSRVLERRGLPGMLVGHIIVETSDERLLVCRRQSAGMHDELGAWSLSIEERWEGHHDAHPHDVVKRGVLEELGIDVRDEEIRVLSWGLETSVLYPGFIAIARTQLGSWEVERTRAHAHDANELRYVTSVPADASVLPLLLGDMFAPAERPELRGRWHRTSKARMFVALSHLSGTRGGRGHILRELGLLAGAK
ncbi:MAG: hypothetical protein HY873_11255 [Chloroflexi bacterium]|nr:hypothetical protein [Chloroflexota bacterium]